MKLPAWQIVDCKCTEMKSKEDKNLGDCMLFKVTFPEDIHPKQVKESSRLKNLKLNVHVFSRGRVVVRMFLASNISYKDDQASMWLGVALDDLMEVYNLAPHVIYKSRLEVEFDCQESVKVFQAGLFERVYEDMPDKEKLREEHREKQYAQVHTTVTVVSDMQEVFALDAMADDGGPYLTERTLFEGSDGGVFLLERCERSDFTARWTGGPEHPGLPALQDLALSEGEVRDSLVA